MQASRVRAVCEDSITGRIGLPTYSVLEKVSRIVHATLCLQALKLAFSTIMIQSAMNEYCGYRLCNLLCLQPGYCYIGDKHVEDARMQ